MGKDAVGLMDRIDVIPVTSQSHFEFIRVLRNDVRIQDGFLERVPITADQQEAYMARYADHYLIAMAAGQPAGYAGSIDNDIRVCTHPEF